MSVLNKLTEGIVNRDMKKEGAALLSKWEKTGLLEGLNDDTQKNGMARLLENQAKELLREAASTMAGGDVQGFSAVAFPIVRRVFGGLIANDLVSVQPMSLPSGLIFFLDFTFGNTRLANDAGNSLYGGGRVGSQITGGVDFSGSLGNNLDRGFYSLNNGYSLPTASTRIDGTHSPVAFITGAYVIGTASSGDYDLDRAIDFDPDLSGSQVIVVKVTGSQALAQLDVANLVAINCTSSQVAAGAGALTSTMNGRLVRRLTAFHSSSTNNQDPTSADFALRLVFQQTSSIGDAAAANAATNMMQQFTGRRFILGYPIVDNFTSTGQPVGGVVGTSLWQLEDQTEIPEINIKVDSVAVTAQTRKLKAKWTPELGQDLNAYHNLDAEVELTSILSEQIALEIDQEILNDLIKFATAGTYYWSRSPGLFVDITTGAEVGAASAAPDFTGTVSEWYETCLERINDVSAAIHRKTLRGGANFIVCGPEVANILEFTAGFRAAVTVDGDRGTAGAVKTGQLSKKLDVYVDPYFPRNVILVGRRGGSFLESGYVYAPYVPLQVTPTIFGVEDFVPRKGVMTRYAKKMVRADMYGLVICRGLIGEAGATS